MENTTRRMEAGRGWLSSAERSAHAILITRMGRMCFAAFYLLLAHVAYVVHVYVYVCILNVYINIYTIYVCIWTSSRHAKHARTHTRMQIIHTKELSSSAQVHACALRRSTQLDRARQCATAPPHQAHTHKHAGSIIISGGILYQQSVPVVIGISQIALVRLLDPSPILP